MKNLKVTWKGISPLIMHSCKTVNPLHPISKEIRKLNDKQRGQKLTEEELERNGYIITQPRDELVPAKVLRPINLEKMFTER